MVNDKTLVDTSGTPVSNLLEYKPISIGELEEFAASRQLFAILDGCGGKKVLSKIFDLSPDQRSCLFEGAAYEQNWAAAPYLIEIDGPVLLWIAAELWQEPWGIFAVSRSKFNVLLKHFRTFLKVRDTENKLMYFRYYDPRVLDAFLPTCTSMQLNQLFGPVSHYSINPSEDEQAVLISRKYLRN